MKTLGSTAGLLIMLAALGAGCTTGGQGRSQSGFNWKATDETGNTIEVVSIDPKSPAALKSLEKVSVRVKYHLATDRPMQVFAHPGTGTNNRSGSLTSGSQFLTRSQQADGEVTRTIMFRYGATISDIVVTMYDREADRKDKLSCRVPYKGVWEDGKPPVFPRAASGARTVTDPEGNSMEVVSVEPDGLAPLKPMEWMSVKVKYRLVTEKPVWISARPYGKDPKARNTLSTQPVTCSKAQAESGVAECRFTFREAAKVDGIIVWMEEAQWGRQMAVLKFPLEAGRPGSEVAATPQPADLQQFTWKASDPNGNWMEVISVEPNSPALLGCRQEAYVKIRYHLGSARLVQILAQPHAVNGAGSTTSGSEFIDKPMNGDGTARRWFSYATPAVTDSIRVTMRDANMFSHDKVSPRPTVLECVVPYSAEWSDSSAQMPAGDQTPKQ
jgi:hypothetical protein